MGGLCVSGRAEVVGNAVRSCNGNAPGVCVYVCCPAGWWRSVPCPPVLERGGCLSVCDVGTVRRLGLEKGPAVLSPPRGPARLSFRSAGRGSSLTFRADLFLHYLPF